MPEYKLSFPIEAGNPSPLKNIAKAAEEIAKQVNLSKTEWRLYETAIKGATAAGVPMSQAIKDFTRNYGSATAGLSAFTSALKENSAAEVRAAAESIKAAKEKERAIQSAARAARQAQSETQRMGRLQYLAELEDKKRTESFSASAAKAMRERFRTGIYGAQIAGGFTGMPLPGGLARHGGNLLNIAGSPTALAAGGAVAGIGIAASAAALLKSEADASRATINLSRELGVTISQARQFENVAKLTGVSVGAFTTGERMLSQALEDQTGRGKNAAESLHRIGIGLVDTDGNVRESGTVFMELIQKIAAIPSQTERAREAVNIFGRGAIKDILPLVENFKAATDELAKFGLTVDDSLIGKTSEAATKFSALGIAYDNLKLKLAAKIEPIVIPVIESITRTLAEPFGKGPTLARSGPQWVQQLREAMGEYAEDPNDNSQKLPLSLGKSMSISEHRAEHAKEFTPGGSAQYDKMLAAQGDREEILAARVSKAKKEYEDEIVKAKNFAGPDVSDAAKSKETAEVNKLRIAYEGLNAQLKNLRDNKAQLERNATTLQSFVDSMGRKDLDPVSAIYAERDKVISQRGMNAGQIATANNQANIAAEVELEKMRSSPQYRFVPKYEGEKRGQESGVEAQALIQGMHPDTTAKDIEGGLRRNSESLARSARDANSMQDAIRRTAEDSARRDAQTDTRLQASLATAGMTGVQKIATGGAIELQGAARERDMQLEALGPAVDKLKTLAELTAEDFKKMEQSAKIVAEYKDREREIAARTLEQISQERQRSAESHASTLTAGIFAAATHSGEQFGRGLGRSIGETMLTNFGKNYIFQRGGPFEKIQGSVPANSFLGKITQGTGLLREESPLVKSANGLNEAAVDLKEAAKQLGAAGGAPSDTTSGFGANIPGYSNFGSGTHGLTGPSSIVSAVKNVFTGTRKYAGPGVSGGAIEPVTQSQIAAGDLVKSTPAVRGATTGGLIIRRADEEDLLKQVTERSIRKIGANTDAHEDLTEAITTLKTQTPSKESVYNAETGIEKEARKITIEQQPIEPNAHQIAANAATKDLTKTIESLSLPFGQANSRLTETLSKLGTDQVEQYPIPSVEPSRPAPTTESPAVKGSGIPGTAAANPPMYFGGMSIQNTVTNALATVGLKKPSEYSPTTHTPIYDYNAPGSPEAAAYKSGKILRNTASGAMNNPDASSMIMRHEETHALLEPYIDKLTNDKALEKYVPRIRQGLEEKSPVYKQLGGLPAENVISEGLAYKTGDGNVPGLGKDESRAFMLKAMKDVDKSARGLYDKLSLGQLKEPTTAKIPDRELLSNPMYFAEPQKGTGLSEPNSGRTGDSAAIKAASADLARGIQGIQSAAADIDRAIRSANKSEINGNAYSDGGATIGRSRADNTPGLPDWTQSPNNVWQPRPLTEHVTSRLGGSNGEGLSGRGGFEGFARDPGVLDFRPALELPDAKAESGIRETLKAATAPSSSGASKSGIEAEAQALLLQNTTALGDLTSAVKAQTKAAEYVASGGVAGEMPGGAAPPVVTGPTGTPVAGAAATTSAAVGAQGAIAGTIGAAGKAIDTLRADFKSVTGSSASGGIGAIGAAVTGFGALTGAITTIAKATGLGVGRGQHGGSSGGGGSDGNGAGVIVQQSSATNGYSNVFNPDTGRFDVQSPSGTIIPGTGGTTGGLKGFLGTAGKDIGSFATLMTNPFSGSGKIGGIDPKTGDTIAGTGTSFGAKNIAAAGADVALGAYTAFTQFQKGGARGALGGVSSILGTAAALDPDPLSKGILGIAALGTGLIKSILGDPKLQRQKQIEKTLFTSQYQAPEALNIVSSTRGTFADIGRDGNIRTSLLSPYPRVTSPYLDTPFRFAVPGTQSSQFGGGGPIVINNNVNNHIQTMDGSNLESFLKKNPNALMEGVAHGLSFGHSPVTSKIKGIIGQG